jgi:hypothetical protein
MRRSVRASPDQIVVCGDEHVELQQASRPALIVPLVSTGMRGKGKKEGEINEKRERT